MALDTAAKRASALGVGLSFVLLVVPDGTIDQGDRQTISQCYSGILATESTLESLVYTSRVTGDCSASTVCGDVGSTKLIGVYEL